MSIKKKILLLTLIILLILTTTFFLWLIPAKNTVVKRAREFRDTVGIYNLVTSYITASNGDFPKSEIELLQKGLLIKADVADGTEYSYRCKDGSYSNFYDFNQFRIAYGITIENLIMRDDKLYDKSTNEQVLLVDLVDGLYTEGASDLFERVSLRWYKLMLQEKQKRPSGFEFHMEFGPKTLKWLKENFTINPRINRFFLSMALIKI